jgi:hypothetical protein
MTALSVSVLGAGIWATGLEGWPRLVALVAGAEQPPAATTRPSPLLLPPAERRRAPDGVAVALEVAREALEAAYGVDVASLASVFASAHGDQAIVDYLCATLATDPTLLSPTRFHHSVHNAAAGYWGIATGDRGPATAIAAGDFSFAAGLFEAAVQACAEDRPVLMVAFDTPAVGLLATATSNTALFGMALVVGPSGPKSRATRLELALVDRASASPVPRCVHLYELARSSPSGRGVVLAEAIAEGLEASIEYPLGPSTTLAVGCRLG